MSSVAGRRDGFGRRGRARSGSRPGRKLRAVSVLAALVVALGVGVLAPSVPSSGPAAGGSERNIAASVCNSVTGPTPSAVLIATAPPSASLLPGGQARASIEVAEVNGSSATSPITVTLPSLFASLPTSPSGSSTLYLAPQSVVVGGTGWNHAAGLSVTKNYSSGVSFRGSGTASLSTEKLAVMASANYGTLTIEVRWHWTLTQPGGSTVTGAWTQPSARPNGTGSLPSEFYPAPYVALLAHSPSPIDIGQSFNETLGGHVAGRAFFLELEFPSNGSVVQAQGGTAPSTATTYVARIVLLDYNHYLTPGTYLVHVHDGCGAMLSSLSVSAIFAAHATVDFVVQPSGCGSVAFNGGHYASGSSATVSPSRTAYAFTDPVCAGHPFQGWSATGGLHVAAAGKLQVSSSGTFTVRYG